MTQILISCLFEHIAALFSKGLLHLKQDHVPSNCQRSVNFFFSDARVSTVFPIRTTAASILGPTMVEVSHYKKVDIYQRKTPSKTSLYEVITDSILMKKMPGIFSLVTKLTNGYPSLILIYEGIPDTKILFRGVSPAYASLLTSLTVGT